MTFWSWLYRNEPEVQRGIILIQQKRTKEVRFWYRRKPLPKGWEQAKLADQ